MERKINILSTVYLVFLALLFMSGALSGILGYVVYFSAFLIPFLVCIVHMKKEGEPLVSHLGLKKEALFRTLVLSMPAVSLIMLVSAVTSMLIFATTGQTNEVNVGNSIFIALIYHALLPAVMEEALFRYLPMRLLSAYSKRTAVFLSAFFFALIHHSLFSIPYAFIAGIIFMSVNLAFDSVWPSVIIHFLNNAISVLFMFGFGAVVYPSLLVLCAVSVVIIILKKREYRNLLEVVLSGGEKFRITPELAVFTAVNLVIAIVALF